MKKYVIITPEVHNLGGAQLYVLRRAKHLKNLGWGVYVIVAKTDGDFILGKDFKDVAIITHVSGSDYPPVALGKKELKKIIQSILESISFSNDDRICIESHTLEGAVMGEYLSSAVKGKHIAYMLAEPKISEFNFIPGKRLFEDKLQNREFVGVSSRSLEIIFGYKPRHNDYVNVGFDENEFIENSIPDLPLINKNAFVIATITRLEKEYLQPFIDAVIDFSKLNLSRSIELIIGGNSHIHGLKESLENKYRSLCPSNLKISFIGYITIGKDFYSNIDVFVGMGTASINAISQSTATLNINPDSNRASGWFGTDTNNFAYTENNNDYPIVEKLQELLDMNIKERAHIQNNGRALFENEFKESICMQKLDDYCVHIDYIDRTRILRVPFWFSLIYNVYHLPIINQVLKFLRYGKNS